ncbi:hypothetical protein EUX98_g3738 [Antrodiella citrinella]|uniref:Methyltransferase type 11 domain-containing protein n=1 Tax=Antrodiella citrinella TaxID=2447956 RepID=A0A4S4MY96_9APHY|nr:hypothetical protein EUX98_g3738 [Antrodiella citrinella]
MKLTNAFGLLADFWLAIRAAFIPTVNDVFNTPSLLFSPSLVSKRFMAYVWVAFADSTDDAGRAVKFGLITPHAHGVVLDIGAGHGHTVHYLDRQKVTQYVALEPNTRMHSHIRTRANAAGFVEPDGSLAILSYGAQDTARIAAALGPVDTIVSVLTLCSVPEPERTLHNLVGDVLKAGGTLLFYEHVRNPREDVAWWQRFWTPMWQTAFDGCKLDRATHVWIDAMPVWETKKVWGKDGEDFESLFWHRAGRFVKKGDA